MRDRDPAERAGRANGSTGAYGKAIVMVGNGMAEGAYDAPVPASRAIGRAKAAPRIRPCGAKRPAFATTEYGRGAPRYQGGADLFRRDFAQLDRQLRSGPWRRAAHTEATGQSGQSGARGRQTVAPSSINAWLNAPGRRGSSHLLGDRREAPRVRGRRCRLRRWSRARSPA